MTARKRGAGEGSFRELPDGRWRAKRSIGSRGSAKELVAYGRTRAEAAAALKRKVDDYSRLADFDLVARWSVADMLDWYTNEALPARVAKGQLSQTSADGYQQVIRLYLREPMARVPFLLCKAAHLERVLASPNITRLSDSYRKHILDVLSGAFSTAERAELREGNPARRVEPPRVETVRKPGVPVDRIRALLSAAESSRMYAYWRLLATLPLRPGEPLGARIADFHLDPDAEHDECLLVEPRLRRLTHYCMRTNLVYTRDAFEVRPGVLTHWRLNDLKRHRARAIWLPPVTVEALRRRLEVRSLERMAAGSEWVGSAMVDHRGRRINPQLVFCSPLGEPLYIQLLRKELGCLCQSAQVPRLTPHELRHAATTLLEEAGVADSVVQQLGGWSDRRMTDYYTGTLDDSCRRAVELLAKLLEG